MPTPEDELAALEYEKAHYVKHGLDERAKAVDVEIRRIKAGLKTAGKETTASDAPPEVA